MIEIIRGLVRPIITFLIISSMVVIVCFLAFKFADAEMAKNVISAFLVLVASLASFWFGSRKTGGQI